MKKRILKLDGKKTVTDQIIEHLNDHQVRAEIDCDAYPISEIRFRIFTQIQDKDTKEWETTNETKIKIKVTRDVQCF